MQDKVIVVSGGAGGIGAEVCAQLAGEGARVVIADLSVAQPEKAAANSAMRGRAIGMPCDITDPAQCKALASYTVKKLDRLDGMVNCAGVSKPHDSLTLPAADWARMVDVQLSGAFYFAQACANCMLDNGRRHRLYYEHQCGSCLSAPGRVLLRQGRCGHAYKSTCN